MCGETFKRLLKFARIGGLKGAIKKTTQQETKSKGKSKSKGRGKRKQTNKQKIQQRKFAAAAKSCGGKGKTRKQFAACMKSKLKKTKRRK